MNILFSLCLLFSTNIESQKIAKSNIIDTQIVEVLSQNIDDELPNIIESQTEPNDSLDSSIYIKMSWSCY